MAVVPLPTLGNGTPSASTAVAGYGDEASHSGGFTVGYAAHTEGLPSGWRNHEFERGAGTATERLADGTPPGRDGRARRVVLALRRHPCRDGEETNTPGRARHV